MPFVTGQSVETTPVFSTEGRWIAYQSDITGRSEIHVQPFPATGAHWQVSFEGGSRPIWSRTGRQLFFREGDRMMAVDVAPGATFAVGPPRRVFEGRYAASYDVANDGRFLMIRSPGRPAQLRLVLNWFEELESRMMSH